MKIRIGNGRHVSLWYDNWHPLGPLEKILGERTIREFRLSRLGKVADIVEGDTWRWPSVRSPTLSDLMRDTLDTFQPDSNREDVLRWEDDTHGIFSLRSAWESLQLRCPRVTWYHIVWLPKCIPRHAFILCLCVVCYVDVQWRIWIIFSLLTHFLSMFWNALHAKCNLPWVQRSWLDTLSWMEQFRGRSMSSIVIRLMFAASIYVIWRERNAMTHGEAPKNESIVIQDIVFTICARVNLCRSLVPSNENRWLQCSWRFSSDIFCSCD
ncbi:uncharacterized protein LOC111376996 [Olea europaea var. sylvestris]|uniref:uncharacterized protein LOC111376996 n=1 Tax=Olea europaea var. sylvestris TaxID=158386 RepID=UPI000C1CEEA4|nr:uncharacterized protein LOC111376996 [Olea europaea var. sylvestris]